MNATGNDNAAPGGSNGRLERLERNAKGELIAHLAGRDTPHEDVSVHRCFPWTLTDQYVSIRDDDGKEIVLLRSLDGLPAATRDLIEQDLAEKFFVPKIKRISSYRAEFGVVYISAETDRGDVTFQIRNRDDVRILSSRRGLFRDVDGNIYEVEDLLALDRASQRHIEGYF